MKRPLAVAILIVVCGASASKADERALNLPIGDPARKGHEMPLVLDGITEAATGDLLTPPLLAERLDRWLSDEGLTEADFVEGSHWYRSWGYNWEYYRDIFVFARRNGIRMVGVNVPRDVVQTVRREGFDGLTPTDSPLRVDLRPSAERGMPVAALALPPRPALAER